MASPGNTSSTGSQTLFTALDKLEEQVTCGICNEQFTDPRTLPCLHSFCLECVKKTFVNLKESRGKGSEAENLIRCPTCKKFAISSDPLGETLPHAHHLTTLIGVKQDFFLPLTYHISSSLCSRHNEEIKLYCIQCSAGVCLECTIKDHAHHEFRRLRLSELYLPEDGEEDGWIKVNHPLLTSLNSWPRPLEDDHISTISHPCIEEESMERHSSKEMVSQEEGGAKPHPHIEESMEHHSSKETISQEEGVAKFYPRIDDGSMKRHSSKETISQEGGGANYRPRIDDGSMKRHSSKETISQEGGGANSRPRIDEGSMKRHSSQQSLPNSIDKPFHPLRNGLPSFRQYSGTVPSNGSSDTTGPSSYKYPSIAPFQQYNRQGSNTGSSSTINTISTDTGVRSSHSVTTTTNGGSKPASRPHTTTTNDNNSDNIFQVILKEYELIRT